MANRVTLPVPPTVIEAHRQWLALHPLPRVPSGAPAPRGSSAGRNEAATVGANLCLPNTSTPAGLSGYQGEVAIAVNPNNPKELVAGANTFYQDSTQTCQAPSGTTYGTQALYGSSDGGQTWTYNCAPWPSSDTGSVGSILFGSDPSVAWDANGNAYASYMLISQNNKGTQASSSIVVAKSADAGASWTPLGIVVNNLSNSAKFDDKDMMAIDTTSGQAYSHTNRLYVIWDENNVERVAYSDNGTSWTTAVVDPSGGDIGGDLAIGPDGTIYAVWNRYSQTGGVGSGDVLMFAKSVDGGASWTSPVQVAQHNLASFGSNNTPPAQDKRGVNAFPAIAVDTDPASSYFGSLYVVYCDFPPTVGSGTDLNTYLIRSTDGGTTWSSELKLNDDTGTATQFFPWLSVDPASGTVVASWYDTRNDPNNKQTQMFFTYSTDGGQTFAPNVQVTSPSSQFSNSTVAYCDENSSDNVNYNPNQYGDYAQITAYGGTAWLIWTDSRQFYPGDTSNADVEDVAVASVAFCIPPGAPTGLSATAPANNQIGLSWSAGSPAGSTYDVYRAVGACGSSGSFSLIASGIAGTSYTDATVSGGTTYAYEVSAVDSTGLCQSALSGCASAAATGACTLPPLFGGLASVTNPQSATCTLALSWAAATPQCNPGDAVYYNVYRSTVSPFTPSASNRIATGVIGTSFSDDYGLSSGTAYYYVVRAVDAASGTEDANTVTIGAMVTGPGNTLTTLYSDNFDGSGHTGLDGWETGSFISGGSTADWRGVQTCTAYSSPNIFRFGGTAVKNPCSANYNNNDYTFAVPGGTAGITIPAGATQVQLSFYHRWQFQSGHDGALLYISTNNSNFTAIPLSAFVSGGYNGTIGSVGVWTGTSTGYPNSFQQVIVNLDAAVNAAMGGTSGAAGKTLWIAFTGYSDGSITAQGWFLDNVSVTAQVPNACTAGAAPGSVKPVPDGKWVPGTPMQASKVAADGSTINLTWDTTTCTDANYNLYWGNGSDLSTYALQGSVCGLGNTGSASGLAMPAVPSGQSFIWWVIVGTDGSQMESSWGKDSSGNERHPAASGQCGFTAKSTATTCP